MHCDPRKVLFGAAVSLCLVTFGCDKKNADTAVPGAEGGGAGADGNNSAPESLSNGGPEPESAPRDEVGTPPPPPAPAPDVTADPAAPPK